MELHASKGLTLSRKTCHPFLILPLELCVHIISYLSQKDIGSKKDVQMQAVFCDLSVEMTSFRTNVSSFTRMEEIV
jgi:hypothetical protein